MTALANTSYIGDVNCSKLVLVIEIKYPIFIIFENYLIGAYFRPCSTSTII